jgi:glycosyltransferase involved in cell wall biosynthesis
MRKSIKSMAILIPYKEYPGGPGTFINNMLESDSSNGYIYTTDIRKVFKVKIILVINYYSIIRLLFLKLMNKTIVVRLSITRPIIGFNGYKRLKVRMINIGSIIIAKYIADGIIFQSGMSRNHYSKWIKYSNTSNKIIYNGFTSVNPKLLVSENLSSLKFVHHSSSIYPENLEFAKLILALNSEYNSNHSLLLVGNLNAEDKIKNYNVTFIDYTERLEALDLILGCDVYFIFHNSASPNSMMEALGLGLPIITLNISPYNEILTHKSNGYLLEFDSINNVELNALNEAIEYCSNNLEKIKQNNINLIKNRFSVSNMANEYNQFFTNLLKS